MCHTMRILYACAYDAALAENGCKSYNTRKESLRDSETDAKHPPPVLVYCPEGRKQIEAGASACEPTESVNAYDEIVCPLKCPTCWDAFIDRLNFSTEEANAMRSKLADTQKNMADIELEMEVCWVMISADLLVNECKADKDSFEVDWDGVWLKVGEAMRKNDHSLAAACREELPGRRLDYDGYESRKKGIIGHMWAGLSKSSE